MCAHTVDVEVFGSAELTNQAGAKCVGCVAKHVVFEGVGDDCSTSRSTWLASSNIVDTVEGAWTRFTPQTRQATVMIVPAH